MQNKKFLLLMLFSSCIFAQQEEVQSTSEEIKADVDLKKQLKSRSGYEADDIGYGGRASVSKQLYLDDVFIPDALRFPEFDRSIQPYYEWKRRVREKYSLQFGQDYTALYQKASDSLTDTDSASAGVYRFYGRWLAVGKEGKNDGAVVFKIENSHRYGAVAPDDFNKNLGYLGSTGYLYSDLGWVLNDFHWQQKFNNDNGGFIIGRADPTDYMDVVDYANPWTTFSNQNVLENRSIAIPDTGFFAGIAYTFDAQWYLKLAASDANGSLEDPGFFKQGTEFFSFAEVGWTPALDERDLKDVHVTLWHVDQRVSESVPEGEGVAFGASWSFDQEWIIFGRIGQSRGKASMMKRSTTVGFSHIWRAYLDVFGLAVNYSEPVDETLREQTTMETFLKIKLAQNIAITPSFQWLINPASNPQQDDIQIYGLRVRMTL
jgi:porin